MANTAGFYFVSCKDVRDGWIDYSGARQIKEADFRDTHRRTRLESQDIVITNSGTIGRMALVTDAPETKRTTFQKSVAVLKPDQAQVVPRWLYYSLMANRERLIAWASGTAQKNLLLRDMRPKSRVPFRFLLMARGLKLLSTFTMLNRRLIGMSYLRA